MEKTPFPHVILYNVLPSVRSKQLKKAVKNLDFFHTSSDLYEFDRTNDLLNVKSLYHFTHFLEKLRPVLQKEFKVRLTKKIDCAAFCYKPTDYLLPHDDQMPGRRIAYIYYLSSCTGGELALYSTINHRPTTIKTKILPQLNTLILFKVSKNSFHEVKEVMNGKRYSLAGWFYDN